MQGMLSVLDLDFAPSCPDSFPTLLLLKFAPTYRRIGKSIRASIGIRTFNNYLQYGTCEELHPVN
jgi:hypothetical protein